MVDTAVPKQSADPRFRLLAPGRPLWRFLRDPIGMISLAVILAAVVLVAFAPLFTSYVAQGLGEPDTAARLLPPSTAHIFGTDPLGRDIWARLLFGGRNSMSIALAVVAVAILIGAPLGILAGYSGGWVDEIVMRITDIFLAFPPLLLAVFLAALMGPGFWNMVLAITLGWWPWYTRIARAQVATLRSRPFVEAAQFMGVPDHVIMRRHLAPFVVGPVTIQGTLDYGSAILTASALSFLGLGLSPPAPDWGEMVNSGRSYFPDRWWCVVFPGMAIFVVALAFSLLGDSLRDAFDPRKRS